jgi:hypothetical protein
MYGRRAELTSHGWNDLPDEIRTRVQDRIGRVTSAVRVDQGLNNDVAARLNRDGRPPVFLKGVQGGGRRAMFLRNEVTTGPLAAGFAPAVLCDVEHEDWAVVAFEWIDGRPADLSPGSADVDRIGNALDALSEIPAGDTRPLRLRWRDTEIWREVAEATPDRVRGWDIDEMCRWSARVPELVDGDRLLHTDLHRDQFLITPDDRVYVIDWGFPAAGAPWVDSAFLSLRLFAVGHSAVEAQRWASQRSGWNPDGDVITAWAVYVAGLWGWFAINSQPGSGAYRRAEFARDYAAWCLNSAAGLRRDMEEADVGPSWMG